METDTTRQTASTTEVLDGLNDLLQLDHDAIGVYDIAIEKLENPDHATMIRGFKQDHERHIRNLNRLIQELGGTPKNEPHATGTLKEGLQSLGSAGGDKGILMAWRTNELQVRTKYDSYASEAMRWPAEVKRVVDENALDEERHYSWVSQTLEKMGVAPGEGMETQAATRVREGVAQAKSAVTGQVNQVKQTISDQVGRAKDAVTGQVDQVKHQAGEATHTVRNRIAGTLEQGASRIDEMADQKASGSGAKARVGDAAHRVADGMESTAQYIREGDTQQMRSDLESRVRQSPMQTLLVAFAGGFLIGRILR